MKPFFTEADCDIKYDTEWILACNPPRRKIITGLSINEANRLLQERGTVVFGHERHETGTCIKWYTDEVVNASVGANGAALLICIEPIKKDSAEKVLREFIETWPDDCGDHGLIKRAKALLIQKVMDQGVGKK